MKLCRKCGTWDMRPGDRCKECGDTYPPGTVGREHADQRYDWDRTPPKTPRQIRDDP